MMILPTVLSIRSMRNGSVLTRFSREYFIPSCTALTLVSAALGDREPGGEAGDVGGEEVLARDRDAHLEDGAHQDAIGRLASRAVDGGDLDAEVVDDRFAPGCALGLSHDRRLGVAQDFLL